MPSVCVSLSRISLVKIIGEDERMPLFREGANDTEKKHMSSLRVLFIYSVFLGIISLTRKTGKKKDLVLSYPPVHLVSLMLLAVHCPSPPRVRKKRKSSRNKGFVPVLFLFTSLA